jgi:hypothetical protein
MLAPSSQSRTVVAFRDLAQINLSAFVVPVKFGLPSDVHQI